MPVQEFALTDLSLCDVMTICNSDPVLREVVIDFFHFSPSGHEIDIHIDATFIRRYPPKRNRLMYHDLGDNTHSLTLSGIRESTALDLLVYFRNTTCLTLRNMDIFQTNKYHFYPCSQVRSLTLIDCQVDREFLEKWLAKMHRTLETVHLNGVTYEFPVPGELPFLLAVPGLRCLILERMKFDQFDLSISSKSPLEELTLHLDTRSIRIRGADGNKLRHLAINTTSDIFLSGEFTALQYLSVRCGQTRVKRDHLSGLQCVDTLTTLVYDMPPPFNTDIHQLLRFKKLRYLKVHCNWYEESVWQEMLGNNCGNAPVIELICIRPTLGYNPSPLLSNEHLLRAIMAYLSIQDYLSLGRIFPYFLTLIPAHHCLTIDQAFLTRYPLKEESVFYECLGQGVHVLKISSVQKETDFIRLMEYFEGIQELRLEGMALKDVEGIASIPPVETLVVGYCPNVDKDYWTALFRRLDSVLRNLSLEDHSQFPILELHNIREYSCESYACAETMTAFLGQNKETLKSLTLSSHRSHEAFLALSTVNPVQLSSVQFTVNRWEQLEPVLSSVDAQTLRRLQVTSYTGKGQVVDTLRKFTLLQHLSLDVAMDWTEQSIGKFSVFRNLISLRINGQVTEAVAFELVQQLPRLMNLELGSQVEPFTNGFAVKLRRYLKDKRRALTLNRTDAFARWQSWK